MGENQSEDYTPERQFRDIVEATRRPPGLKELAEATRRSQFARIHLQAVREAQARGDEKLAAFIAGLDIVEDDVEISGNEVGITDFKNWYLS